MKGTKLYGIERSYGTDQKRHFVYHRVVERDGGLGLKFPGFLIGIEKAKREKIRFDEAKERLCKEKFVDVDNNKNFKRIKKILNDPKRMFVSHMVEYSLYKDKDCIKEDIFYNAYEKKFDPSKENKLGAYLRGLEALNELKKKIENNFNYTHIILCSMGWNTDQQESLRNYNSLISLMIKECEDSKKSFKPLFIGISWPSELRMNKIFKLFFWLISLAFQQINKITWLFEWIYTYVIGYKIKADDADEVGIIWVNKILCDILIPINKEKKIPLVLMGHSFGARIVTRAAFSKGLIVYGENKKPNDGGNVVADNSQEHFIDLIIGLQGAFSVNRFIPKVSWEGAPYKDFCKYAKKCIFTWSEHDKANPRAFWSDHIGGGKGYKRSLKHKDIFDHFKINTKPDRNSYDVTYNGVKKENGTQSNEWRDSFNKPNKISIVDASDLIKNKSYDKGGKAHSDIFTPGVANFMWDCINKGQN